MPSLITGKCAEAADNLLRDEKARCNQAGQSRKFAEFRDMSERLTILKQAQKKK